MTQTFRNVVVDDTHGQPLDNGGFANARLADEYRIVFGTARQNLNRPADFMITADNRIQFAFFGLGGNVDGKLLQRLKIVFSRFRIGQTPFAVFVDCLIKLDRINAAVAQNGMRFGTVGHGQRLQNAFQSDIFVIGLIGKLFGLHHYPGKILRHHALHRLTGNGRDFCQFGIGFAANLAQRTAGLQNQVNNLPVFQQ